MQYKVHISNENLEKSLRRVRLMVCIEYESMICAKQAPEIEYANLYTCLISVLEKLALAEFYKTNYVYLTLDELETLSYGICPDPEWYPSEDEKYKEFIGYISSIKREVEEVFDFHKYTKEMYEDFRDDKMTDDYKKFSSCNKELY